MSQGCQLLWILKGSSAQVFYQRLSPHLAAKRWQFLQTQAMLNRPGLLRLLVVQMLLIAKSNSWTKHSNKLPREESLVSEITGSFQQSVVMSLIFIFYCYRERLLGSGNEACLWCACMYEKLIKITGTGCDNLQLDSLHVTTCKVAYRCIETSIAMVLMKKSFGALITWFVTKRSICVSKKFVFQNGLGYTKKEANSNSPWVYIREGLLSKGYLRLRFWVFIFGRAYFWEGLLSEFYGIVLRHLRASVK